MSIILGFPAAEVKGEIYLAHDVHEIKKTALLCTVETSWSQDKLRLFWPLPHIEWTQCDTLCVVHLGRVAQVSQCPPHHGLLQQPFCWQRGLWGGSSGWEEQRRAM